MHPLLEYKLKYESIYTIKIDKNHFILFTLLSWKEFKAIRDTLSISPSALEDIKDYVTEKCLIEYGSDLGIYIKDNVVDIADINRLHITYNEFLEYSPAGVVDLLFSSVMQLSGAVTLEDYAYSIYSEREYGRNLIENQIIGLLASAYKLREEEVSSMQWPNIVKLVGQYEMLTGNELNFTSNQSSREADSEKMSASNKHLSET